jgi:hypothetical protein
MKKVKVLILLFSVLTGFTLPITAGDKKARTRPTLKLTRQQMKTLNQKLPFKVRNYLEAAETLEIWTDTKQEPVDEKPIYTPNRKYAIKKAATQKKVLFSFYKDLATGGSGGAACWSPNHTIIARRRGEEVTIFICFTCHKIVVSGAFGEWSAVMRSEPSSEDLINDLLFKYGVSARYEGE